MSEKGYKQAMAEMNDFLARLEGRKGPVTPSEYSEFSELEQGVFEALRLEKEENQRQERLNRRYGSPYMSKWVMR